MGRQRDRALILVALLALALNVCGLDWGLPPRGYFAWDVDGIAPLQPLVAAKRMLVDDWWNSGYYNKFPMGHFFVLMAAYAPYLGWLWLTGGLANPTEVYPFGFADPETALTVLSLIARSIAALMGVGIVVLVYLTARRLAGRRAALFAGLTVAFSPAFIFYAHTGNVDTPSLFWSALGLYAFGRLVAGECALGTYVLLGAATGMAAATKEQALGLFLLVPLSVLVLHAGHQGVQGWPGWAAVRAAGDRKLLAGLAASLVVFAAATHLVFNWDGNMLRLQWRLFHVHPTYGTDYPRNIRFDDPVEGLGQIATSTLDVMNPVLFAAAIAGVVVLPLRHRWARHLAVPLASYVLLVVAMLDSFRARFVMPAALVLALFAGAALAQVWEAAMRRSRALAVPFALLGIYAFAYGAEVDYLLLRDARYDAEAWLDRAAPPGATVEAYAAPVYSPRFPPDVEVAYRELTAEDLQGLAARAPDYLVLSSVHYSRAVPGTEEAALLERLLRGDFGYRPVRVFRRDPRVSPRLIPGLSPEIVVLGKRVEGPIVMPLHVP